MTDYSRSNPVLSPSFEEAELFLQALAGKDTAYTFQTFDDVKNRQDKTLARIYQGTFNQHKAALAALNAKGAGVYVTVNQTDLKGRSLANIVKVRSLFVDLDGSPIQPIKDLPEDLQPHIIIESSPNRWHAYWLVNNCELDQFKPLQQALAAKFDGDMQVCDLPRVMRLAGFSHNKKDPFITRIVELQESNLAPYSVNKLIHGLGLELEAPKKQKQTFANANPANPNYSASGSFDDVKRAAQGQWDAILSRLGITLPPHNIHAPCPACGGTDRFRYDNQEGHGTFICSQGGNGILSGDGFALIQHKTGATSSEVLNMVRGIVMPEYQQSEQYHYANSNEWQDPESIIAYQDSEDYPLEQLPEPLRLTAIAIANYLQCPIAMVVSSIIGALSLSIQGLVNVARDNELISVISLFLLLIAESGERKSACDKMTTQHLKDLDLERFKADNEARKEYAKELKIWQAKLSGAENALKRDSEKGQPTHEQEQRINALYLEEPAIPRSTTFLLEDTTPEGLIKAMDKGHPFNGIFSSEAGIVFGSHGMSSESAMRNMATLNKFWDGEAIRVTRSDIAKNTLLTGRRLTLNLAIQASAVRAFFEGSKGLARGTGFGARFLIAWPKSTQGFRPYKEPVNSFTALDSFKRRTLELINTDLVIDEKTGAIEAHTLTLSTKAKAVWVAFFNDTEAELKTGGELTNIKDVTSKAGDNAARLAALFHVYEHGTTGTISEDHMTKACHLMAWYLMESRRFFGEIALPKELSNATLLDTWLIDYCKDNKATRISTRTAKQLCPNPLRTKEAFSDTVKHLTELSRLRTITEGKKKWLEINPKLLEA